ncbi:signal peptidase I [uncultured Kordia sp.]|uniref:signal peptidase I n=1 Tax=uncultured Kordia sp. TaxID=507699 RepID=UPI00262CC5EB|nr:signal peptidase I [uncultured Kordia sp.]
MSKSLKSNISKIVFILFFGLIICFFIWSRLFIVSLLLVLFIDCISTQFLYKFLKRKLTKNTYTIIKYSTYLIFPIGLAIFFRIFIFEIYSIPSSSMERILSKGEMIVINKLDYGPKMPNSITEVPFGSLFSSEKTNDTTYNRLSGFEKIERNDIIVFKSFKKNSSKKFIKRIIGLPGETIQIVNSNVSINEQQQEELSTYVFDYITKDTKGFIAGKTYSNTEYKKLPLQVQQKITRNIHLPKTIVENIFPKEKVFDWTRDFYGPITIPKKGNTIQLTMENIIFYEEAIALETQKTISIQNDIIYLDNEKINSYTFLFNYFFVMGDNRHFSNDSRAIGFVPEYTIQGKLWFSF